MRSDELAVLNLLNEACIAFSKLDEKAEYDDEDFAKGIRNLQSLVLCREPRRNIPKMIISTEEHEKLKEDFNPFIFNKRTNQNPTSIEGFGDRVSSYLNDVT